MWPIILSVGSVAPFFKCWQCCLQLHENCNIQELMPVKQDTVVKLFCFTLKVNVLHNIFNVIDFCAVVCWYMHVIMCFSEWKVYYANLTTFKFAIL